MTNLVNIPSRFARPPAADTDNQSNYCYPLRILVPSKRYCIQIFV